MPVSREMSRALVNKIFKGKAKKNPVACLKSCPPEKFPLPPCLPRERVFSRQALKERLKILGTQGITFKYVNGQKRVPGPEVFGGNIESYIGQSVLPLGVVGPLRVNGLNAHGDFYVPMAATEGALVASHNRGAKIIGACGGARVACLTERVSRAPGFVFKDFIEAGRFIAWCVEHFAQLHKVVKTKTRHGKLEDVSTTLEGNHVFLRFEFTTGEASGQNMVTVATQAICEYLVSRSPVKPRHWFVESNMSGDKKATAMSYLYVRGKKVTAEVSIPENVVRRMLHTDARMVLEYWKMSFVGGVQSGSIGVQGHYANGLAGLFIACGQDVACVSEASVGITRVDVTDDGALYFAVSLPNLIVGTVGGGTGLPTQKECLRMLGCEGPGSARKFAEICAVTVLAGEISIMGALAAGEFAAAHAAYRRRKTG
ncbi:MAG: 3-hydroxy-3-methylglutaryl-CoA reductase [Candidatus Omnitrophica bacterium]|nr:3-hydroxy-3-methylglutaryl-CoA reductase [Candidatus Omnitrophota bacterium]